MRYIGFSSTKLGAITLENPEAVTSVTAEIREPILDLPVARYDLTAEEIASGRFELPPLESGELYFEHRDEYERLNTFPEEFELHVVMTYDTGDGEQTVELTRRDEPEQGWAYRYWSESEQADEWTYPGTFRFSTYESPFPIALVYDDPEAVQTLPDKIVLSVALSIDGRAVSAEDCELVEDVEEDPFADYCDEGEEIPTWYYARLFLKLPDWAPKSGTIHITVVQQLFSDGSLWTSEQDYEYSN